MVERAKLILIIEAGVKALGQNNVDIKNIDTAKALERFIFKSDANEAIIQALFKRTQKEAAQIVMVLNEDHYEIFDEVLLEVIRNLSNRNTRSRVVPTVKSVAKPVVVEAPKVTRLAAQLEPKPEPQVLPAEPTVQPPGGPVPRVHKITLPADSPLLAYLQAAPLVASIKEKQDRDFKARFWHYAIITGLAILGAVLGGGIAIAVAGFTWPVLVAAALSAVVFGGARAIYVHAKSKENTSANSAGNLSRKASAPAQEAATVATKISIDNPALSTSIQSDLPDGSSPKSASTKLGNK